MGVPMPSRRARRSRQPAVWPYGSNPSIRPSKPQDRILSGEAYCAPCRRTGRFSTDRGIGDAWRRDRADVRGLLFSLVAHGRRWPDGRPRPDSDHQGIRDRARRHRALHAVRAHAARPLPLRGRAGRGIREAASDDYVEEEAGQRESARRVLERIERPREGTDAGPRLLGGVPAGRGPRPRLGARRRGAQHVRLRIRPGSPGA